MRHEDAVMLILDHHHTIIRTQRVVAVHVTLRRWGEGQQLPQHLLGGGQIGANVIHPTFDRRLGNRNQEQRGKKDRNVPETDSTYHHERARQPDHAVAHMLGGRDTLDGRRKIYPLLVVIEIGTLRYDKSIQNRIVKRRQFMHIDVVGFLAPTERGLRPQLLVKVVPAQIKLDNRRAIFDRGADKGVLVYLRDN